MNDHFDGHYSFKKELNTQRKLKDYFKTNPHVWAEEKLISLCANVLFLVEEKDGNTVYHPRFNLIKTDSYKCLPDNEKEALYGIYIDYFYKRQDEMWYKSGMEKLPEILNSTNMLICAEDLGLVPNCVPQVMDRLGITALKIQRMPSENISYSDPKNTSYLNVVTTSSHDSSTLRQWWKEDRTLTQNYFAEQLQQMGTAPAEMEPGIAELIIKQHLYNDAMLAIFPIQDFLATDFELRNTNLDEERINIPANFPHYWKYRMHISLDTLNNSEKFNDKIATWIINSNRN
jgi:4-alpha-glucanotransferase